MEAFFDRELQRLDFTTQRMDVRAKEKKVIDTAKVEAGDKVCLTTKGESKTDACFISPCLKLMCRMTTRKQL